LHRCFWHTSLHPKYREFARWRQLPATIVLRGQFPLSQRGRPERSLSSDASTDLTTAFMPPAIRP
jgi:hypothetical protein